LQELGGSGASEERKDPRRVLSIKGQKVAQIYKRRGARKKAIVERQEKGAHKAGKGHPPLSDEASY